MPSIEAIDRIKNVVNSLGNEQAILQEKGSAIEDVMPPENQPDEDLQDLLASGPELEDMTTMDSLLSSLEEGLSPEDDFSLDDLVETPSEEPIDEIFDDLDGLNEAEDSLVEDLGIINEESEGNFEDLDSLEEIESPTEPEEELVSLDDLGVEEVLVDDELEPIEELEADEDLGDLDDLDDLGSLDDLDDLGDIDELEDLGDLGELDDIDADLSQIPDTDSALSELSESLDETPESNEQEEIVLDEDFGLNEIEDDFLDDLNDEDENQFSLDDLGAEYNFSDDDTTLSTELGLDLDELEKNIDQASDAEAGPLFEMTQDELERFEAALHNLPLNFKIVLQNFLGDEDTPVDQINKLTNLILDQAPIKSIAASYKKFSGKKIDIPRGYEKRSAEEFQKEKDSLPNYIKEKVIPRIIMGLGIFFALWALVVILFNFVYRPLKAESLYNEGEELIARDSYNEGEEHFDDAFFGWEIGSFNVQGIPRKEKFYTYAQAYEDRRKYDRAEEKYQQLLQAYPQEVEGRIAYGNLLSERMVRFKDAEYILKGADPLMLTEAAAGLITYEEIPLKEITEINDVDQLILLGDNYLSWAEEDPDKYENARYIYATLLKEKRGGRSDKVLLRMLRYLIKVKNKEEIERLRLTYSEQEKVNAPSQLQAEVFSELAGWLIDNDRVMESREFILKAEKADRSVPDGHYQYARFFHETYNYEDEKDALTNALGFLEQQDVLDKDHLFMQIDSYRRLGNLSLYVGDYSKAEENYNLGLEIYENSHNLNLIGTSPEIGALYGEMGNLNYDRYKDYDRAMEFFIRAEENFGETPEIHYKKGFINYSVNGEYQKALMELYRVSRYYPENRNLLLAMGNTLQQRGDYYGAISHYEQLLTQLKIEEDNIKVLLPDEKEEEWALIEYLIMTYNNLGAAQNGVAQKTPNRSMRNQSLASFTASSEYFDKLLRNRNNSTRTEVSDQAGLNRQALLDEPDSTAKLELYNQILPHLNDIPANFRSNLQE